MSHYKHFKYIDGIKGCLIILVIIGHTIYDGLLKNVIYAVHMPLFFFISGLFFYKQDVIVIIKNKGKRLLIPYYATSTVLCIGLVSKSLIKSGISIETWNVFVDVVMSVVYASGKDSIVGVLWYLWALLFAFVFLTLCIDRKYSIMFFITLFIVGLYTSNVMYLPLSLQSGMTAATYLYCGYKYNKKNYLNSFIIKKTQLVIMTLIWIFVASVSGKNYLVNNEFSFWPLNLLVAVVGSILIIESGKYIFYKYDNPIIKKILEIGKYTLPIMCVHLLEMRLIPWYKIQQIIISITQSSDGTITIITCGLKIIIALMAIEFVKRSKLLNKIYM